MGLGYVKEERSFVKSAKPAQRFQQEHDWFWQEAHRIGENDREGFHPLYEGVNPHLRMHQEWPWELREWIEDEPWY
jgi:hypothetical protein